MIIQQIWATEHAPMKATANFGTAEANVLEMLSLASNATIEVADGEEIIIGDPTESAIIRLLEEKGTKKNVLEEKYPRVIELPFDSDRKLMTTIH